VVVDIYVSSFHSHDLRCTISYWLYYVADCFRQIAFTLAYFQQLLVKVIKHISYTVCCFI